MAQSLNQLALMAAVNDLQREELICSQENLILRTAASVTHSYVDKSDDAWSVALEAFSRAIDLYSAEKGDFLPFAQMLIKRSLIDFYRSQKRERNEVSVAPHILEGESEPEEDTDGAYLAVIKVSREAGDHGLREEILAANEMLSEYGFRFFDLTECSPQQEKTRKECAAAIRTVLMDQDMLAALVKSRRLPIKSLAASSGVSRKTLDRYRKYIIMAVLILDGDYPQIADYLKFVKEE